jgi:hypothetical protein
MKLAIRDGGSTKFVKLEADDEWVKQHGSSDEAETVALATAEAQRAVEVATSLVGARKDLAHVRLTTKIPDGSISLVNPQLERQGLTCYICLWDASGSCVCTPC